ncbi:MAG: hypothetical protein LBS69_07105 [Prevotellaceae bacterium]|jgi:hypothetical protein|nr:hypothetical protein [Prevotellaceae bacterium]
MERENFNDEYQEMIKSYTDEELAEIYLLRADYDEAFIELTVEELGIRGIPVEKLTSENEAMQFLMSRKTDEELRNIYTGCGNELQTFAEREAMRRGMSSEALEKEKTTAAMQRGVQGKHVFAGYLFSILGGLIGLFIALDYITATKSTDGGEFNKYNDSTRKAGKGMLIVFAISLTIFIIQLNLS